MKSADMPSPWSTISIARLGALLASSVIRTGTPAGLASIAFWTRWPSACSSRTGSAIAAMPWPPELDRMDPLLDLGDGSDDLRRPRIARGSSASRAVAAVEPGEQVVHLLHRALQRRDHVLAELGLVGVPLGVADDEAELADQILDVVHDEGEAAVEFVEPPGVGERLLAARLGEIARRLDPGGAEQVEILPVERPPDQRMLEQDQADEPIAVDQRHAGPEQPRARPASAGSRRSRRASVRAARRAAGRNRRRGRSLSRKRISAAILGAAVGHVVAPVPARGEAEPAAAVGHAAAGRRAIRRCRRCALMIRSPSGAVRRRADVRVKRSHSSR